MSVDNASGGTGAAKPSDRYLMVLILVVIVALAVSMPFTLGSIRSELFQTEVDTLYEFPSGEPVKLAQVERLERIENYYNFTFLAVDENAGTVSISVSANRDCSLQNCPELEVTLIAYNDDAALRRGLPPSTSIKIARDDVAFSEQVTLPVVGWPSQYPFDRYRLRLGAAFSELVDGKAVYLAPDRVTGYSLGTIQNATRDFTMTAPKPVPVDQVFSPSDSFTPAGVQDVELRRPTYLWVLSVTLVSLVAISSLMSLFSRQLGDALVGIGSMVLGVWGVRSVLVPSGIGVVTAIDISLSLVIMALLIGLKVKSFQQLWRRSPVPVRLPKRRKA
ncbi:MAG: hypothetical protein ACKOWF_18090 [Chloroflexota bacterium]